MQIVLEAVIVRRSVASPDEWDDFARRAGASFRCSYRAARAWQFHTHRLFRLRRLEVFIAQGGREAKIGQCAVGVGRRSSVFSDSLQLPADRVQYWAMAMAEIVRHLGEADYVYGSDWNLEEPREQPLAEIEGVTITSVAATSIDVIEFARWGTFAEFVRATSSNVRRNVRKAAKTYPLLHVDIQPGMRGTADVLRTVALRADLFRRKGITRSSIAMAMRSISRLATLRHDGEIALLRAGRRILSSYVGVRFGSQFCYLEGASVRDGQGAAWFLLMAMIERAFVTSGGTGRFVMGSDDGSQAGIEAWEGLRRSRRQCCATPIATSIVRFRFSGVRNG